MNNKKIPYLYKSKELHLTSPQKPCKKEERGMKEVVLGFKKTHQPRFLYPEKLSPKCEEIKIFPEKQI